MPGNQALSRGSAALLLPVCAAAAVIVAGCGGNPGTATPPEGTGASLLTALSQVADTANNRSWVWYDDTAALARLAAPGPGHAPDISPAFQAKGFESLRGTGTGTSTLETAQGASDTGIDIYNEGYAVSAGTLPKELTLVHGGQNALVVTAHMIQLGWRDNGGTLMAPSPLDARSPHLNTQADGSYTFTLSQVRASGSDVKFGNANTDLSEIGTASGPTLADDPLMNQLARCLGDVVAAEFNVRGSYYGEPVGRHPVEVAIGIRRPPSNSATPRAVVCAAWPSQGTAEDYARDLRKVISSGVSITARRRYAADLRKPSVTVIGGPQHVVEWQADTPGGVRVVFGMMQLYDMPALPNCKLVPAAIRARTIGCS